MVESSLTKSLFTIKPVHQASIVSTFLTAIKTFEISIRPTLINPVNYFVVFIDEISEFLDSARKAGFLSARYPEFFQDQLSYQQFRLLA